MSNDEDEDNYPGKLLHQAALYLNVDLLKDLLTGDEINNIDATDRFGCTPLHTACISAAQATVQNDTKVLDSSLEFIMALIDHGADLNIQSGERYDYQVSLQTLREYILLCAFEQPTSRSLFIQLSAICTAEKMNALIRHTLLLMVATSRFVDSLPFVIGCYFTNWSQYRSGLGHFNPSYIDPTRCTHLYYAFANIDTKARSPSPFEINDVEPVPIGAGNQTKSMYEQIYLLKAKNRRMKTLLTLGGATVNSSQFRQVFDQDRSRREFVRNTIKYLRKYRFDGLDLDWEFPESETDRRIFSSMVRDYRAEFQNEASTTNRTRLLLTAAVAAHRAKIELGYDVDEICRSLDYVNLMAYDYHGSWNVHTGFNSPLYPRATETDQQRLLNQQATVKTWVDGGCPRAKLVLGLGTYGRTFRVTKQNATVKPYTPSLGAGASGAYTGTKGFLAYYEICDAINRQNWSSEYDKEQQVPFAYKNDQWVGYDNQLSIEQKCRFVARQRLAGVMIWSLDLDDFRGSFCKQGRYPLLTRAKTTLESLQAPKVLPNASASNTFDRLVFFLSTPLHMIAQVGNEKILALLLFHKADVTSKDKHGETPLTLAQLNRKVDSVEMIQNEIELRQQVRQETEKKLLDACFDGDVEKAAECLAHLGAHAKAVLNSSPNGSDTLNFLYRACRTGNVELVKLLLKHGAIAKPHRQTSYSPLYIACRIGNLEIVQMLLSHFPHLVSVATLEQILPFAAACSQGHLSIVQLLLTYPSYPFASCYIHVDRLQRSYVFPFNLNAQDLNEQTSLYLAVLGGHTDVVEYLLSFRVHGLTSQEVELFKRRSTHSYFTSESSIITLSEFNSTLQKIAPAFCPFNLDIYSNNGRAALHEAIEQQNCRIVHLLVSNGANVNLPYEEVTSRVSNQEQCFVTRSTPLSCACRLGNVQLIEYLLNSHATDKEFLAYNSCKQSYLIGHLLKYRVLQDNEFKLTKRQLTSNALHPFDEQFWSTIDPTKIWMHVTDEKKVDSNNNIPESNYSMENTLKRRPSKRYQILSTGFEQIRSRFTTRSAPMTSHIPLTSPVPSTPVGIQWHHYGPLKKLDPLWFLQAAIFVNKDTFTQLTDFTPNNRHLLLHCITRIDLSDNALESLPTFLFQMYSLRILNVSNNQLGELPQGNHVWLCHQLVELDVSHNALTSLPAAMFQLRSLQRAYAAHNQLQSLPVEMWTAPVLTDLNVANNSLKELPAPSAVSTKHAEKPGRHMTSRHPAGQNRTASELRPQAIVNSPTKSSNAEMRTSLISSSATTANLAVLSAPLSAPPRSTTFAQLGAGDMPPSPDDDDELERRANLKISYQNTPPSSSQSIPVKRHCLWQNHISQSADDDQPPAPNAKSSVTSSSTTSRLNNLNLSHNQFEFLPPMLCCLTPYLTSLNLSYNLLTDASNISSYPPRLKTLDLSFNRLQNSILAESSASTARKEKSHRRTRHHETVAPENICYRPELKENNSQLDAAKRRRSRSVSRHKLLATASLSIGPSKSDPSESCCPHRRHVKLEFLHDLNLSDNQIDELILSSTSKPSAEADSVVGRLSLLFPAVARLNLSQNKLVSIPTSIALLDNLGTLILRDNPLLREIPLSIGSMQKLWNLDLHGCGRPNKK